MSYRLNVICLTFIIATIASCSISSAQQCRELLENLDAPWLPSETKSESGNEAEDDRLETDRDSFTPATTTVKRGRVLVESAYSFIENRNTANSNSFPEMVTRIGLTKRVELRVGWNFESGGGGSVSNGDAGGDIEEPGSRRESELLYGLKIGVTEQQSWIPESACIIQGTTPTSGPDMTGGVQLGYVFGWKLFDDWKLDSSIRYVTAKEEGDNFNQWAPSIVLKVPVADRWNVHGEYFGIFTNGKADNSNAQYFSPGIHYLVTNDCEVGVRVGWGLNQDAASFFTNVGFGYQF